MGAHVHFKRMRCYAVKLSLISLSLLHTFSYDVASEKYIHLLRLLHQRSGTLDTTAMIVVPELCTIYHNTAEVLYKACRYTDCIAVCDHGLDTYAQPRGEKTGVWNGEHGCSMIFTFLLFCTYINHQIVGEFQGCAEWWHVLELDVNSLKYKAFALFELGENENAFSILDM